MNAQQINQGSEAMFSDHAIAVIGYAGRFPGADSVEALWERLAAGDHLIDSPDDESLKQAGVPDAALSDPRYVKAAVSIADAEYFDAGFFGYGPKEAALIDPQQRLFLESAWQALEHAGYDAARYHGAIGVYAGSGSSTYLLNQVLVSGAPVADVIEGLGGFQAFLGNDRDFLSTRVSYKLGLTGPSLTLQTACSTSLVAVHLACQALNSGECEIALAGGVSLFFPQGIGYFYADGMILSPDGVCRPFDADAAGTVPGNGLGMVVLKRYADAVADGDTIHAVLIGSAINNDGAAKMGYTAPSVEGQASVIEEAIAVAGIGSETIGYVEAHGTGT
ncbi:beta-ketoacyl synthase N-terminal-like domain-containing protein, partial [Chitinolyticbacter albus]|uniref:beta-ketoacyl synthase N-terminal-like domain-containing protein n=1 Tax=Chitinolyticbacter albus TaxID=2961951 RepID=UPI00210A9238